MPNIVPANAGGRRRRPETNRAGAIIEQARKDAFEHDRAVRILAKTVADYMQEMHGGEFRVKVDHECGLVVVAQFSGNGAIRPKRGEVV